jgi:hypothetical protein
VTDRVVLYIEPDVEVPLDFSSINNTFISENCTIVMKAGELGFFVVEVPANESYYYQNELSKLPWVRSVEPDCIRMTEMSGHERPDDPFFPDQWAFNRTHIPEAWEILSSHSTTGNVTVAIIDTGVDARHEDLSGIMKGNGMDWVENRSALKDSDGHGTFLAGIVGAATGYYRGISGVGRVSLLPEKIGTNGTEIFASRSAAAIQHAADQGARIILMGYGGHSHSPAEDAAIAYATRKGCILVASAGNEASNEGHYPSDHSEVISVGSTAKTDGLSYFSNYGIFVELVAPGEAVVSTWPDNTYQTATGTSPAAALVAGTAALILDANPALNRDQVREILSSTSRDLGRTGRDIYYGYGMINAAEAVRSADENRKGSDIINTLPSSTPDLSGNGTANSSHRILPGMEEVKRRELMNRESVEIPLHSGWNFLSLSSVLGSGKNSGDIFQGINTDGHTIWKFNSSNQDWVGVERETALNPLEGLLVYSDRDLAIPLVLNNRNKTPEINLSPGWNLVGSPYQTPVPASKGLSSLSSDWVSLLFYNSTNQSYDPAIIQGASGVHSDARTLPAFSAYWVYMNRAGIYRGSVP